MKAIVYHAPRDYSYQDVPDLQVGPEEVLIRVKACGICGTDLHIHEGEFLAEFPLTPGHEIAGLGAHVRELPLGTRLVADNTELCGSCFYCRRDQPLFCENFVSHGCNTAGGLAEYVSLPAAKVFPIHNLSWREAVMVEPTACAIHGMDVIAIKTGQRGAAVWGWPDRDRPGATAQAEWGGPAGGGGPARSQTRPGAAAGGG